MDTRWDDVLDFERLPYKAHHRMACAAAEADRGRRPNGPRVQLAIGLAVIASRVREARAAQVRPEPCGLAGHFAPPTRTRPRFAGPSCVILE
jgi:hypothetical protein